MNRNELKSPVSSLDKTKKELMQIDTSALVDKIINKSSFLRANHDLRKSADLIKKMKYESKIPMSSVKNDRKLKSLSQQVPSNRQTVELQNY